MKAQVENDNFWRAALWLAEDLLAGGPGGRLVASKRRELLRVIARSSGKGSLETEVSPGCPIEISLHAIAIALNVHHPAADVFPATITAEVFSRLTAEFGSAENAAATVASICRPRVNLPDKDHSEAELKNRLVARLATANRGRRQLQ